MNLTWHAPCRGGCEPVLLAEEHRQLLEMKYPRKTAGQKAGALQTHQPVYGVTRLATTKPSFRGELRACGQPGSTWTAQQHGNSLEACEQPSSMQSACYWLRTLIRASSWRLKPDKPYSLTTLQTGSCSQLRATMQSVHATKLTAPRENYQIL